MKSYLLFLQINLCMSGKGVACLSHSMNDRVQAYLNACMDACMPMLGPFVLRLLLD